MSHNILIIIALAVILYFQSRFFLQNIKKLSELKSIFPNHLDENIYLEQIDGVLKISYGSASPIFTSIIETLNSYLSENKGAASDFHLIKDVVDRHCEAVEEEIETLTPIPLYLGLIGTMFGILVGVGFLAFTGGLDELLNAQSTNAGSGIVELLGGVALAMISSIFGILLTTTGSYLTKDAKNNLNNTKNCFLSWIQVKLLPSLTNNSSSAIYTLQQNLSTFNKSFAENIGNMNDAFSAIGNSHKDQIELLKLIDKMDVHRISTANIDVLKELQNSTGEFEKFNQYLHNVTGYLESVQKLNAGVNDHLNRTHAIEEMGIFFKEEIQQIESRKSLINSVVGSIDNSLHTTIEKLKENGQKQIDEYINHTTIYHEQFIDAANKQQEKANLAIEEQRITLSERLNETSQLLDEMKNLANVKSSMHNIENYMSDQNSKLDKLSIAISILAENRVGVSEEHTIEREIISSKPTPIWMKVTIISTSSIVGIAGLMYIIIEIANIFNTTA